MAAVSSHPCLRPAHSVDQEHHYKRLQLSSSILREAMLPPSVVDCTEDQGLNDRFRALHSQLFPPRPKCKAVEHPALALSNSSLSRRFDDLLENVASGLAVGCRLYPPARLSHLPGAPSLFPHPRPELSSELGRHGFHVEHQLSDQAAREEQQQQQQAQSSPLHHHLPENTNNNNGSDDEYSDNEEEEDDAADAKKDDNDDEDDDINNATAKIARLRAQYQSLQQQADAAFGSRDSNGDGAAASGAGAGGDGEQRRLRSAANQSQFHESDGDELAGGSRLAATSRLTGKRTKKPLTVPISSQAGLRSSKGYAAYMGDVHRRPGELRHAPPERSAFAATAIPPTKEFIAEMNTGFNSKRQLLSMGVQPDATEWTGLLLERQRAQEPTSPEKSLLPAVPLSGAGPEAILQAIDSLQERYAVVKRSLPKARKAGPPDNVAFVDKGYIPGQKAKFDLKGHSAAGHRCAGVLDNIDSYLTGTEPVRTPAEGEPWLWETMVDDIEHHEGLPMPNRRSCRLLGEHCERINAHIRKLATTIQGERTLLPSGSSGGENRDHSAEAPKRRLPTARPLTTPLSPLGAKAQHLRVKCGQCGVWKRADGTCPLCSKKHKRNQKRAARAPRHHTPSGHHTDGLGHGATSAADRRGPESKWDSEL